MPSQGFVYRFFATLGELGILNPKSQQIGGIEPPEGRDNFIINQRLAIKKALQDYKSDLLVIFNLNFGHTDPQIIIPNGGIVLINGIEKTISFQYNS